MPCELCAPALLLIVWTTGVCIPRLQTVSQTDEAARRGFAKRAALPPPFTFCILRRFGFWWWRPSLPPSLPSNSLVPAIATHPLRRNFECSSRIRIGRPDSAVGQSAAVDTHSVGATDRPEQRPPSGRRARAGNGGPSPRFWVRK